MKKQIFLKNLYLSSSASKNKLAEIRIVNEKLNSFPSLSNTDMLAPYATISNTGETFFSFAAANSDGLTHFRSFGSGVIGLEDLKGGGDQDFDDLILGFNFQLTSV